MYSMQAVASSLFRVVCFPFNGKIIMIGQTSFYNLSVNAPSGNSIPIIDLSQPKNGSVGVGMYPSLMGTFSYLAPILMIRYIFGGYSEDSKGYKLINLSTNKSFIERCVKFEEEPLAEVEVGEALFTT